MRSLSRFAWIAVGLAAFVWLALEDRGLMAVQLLAAGLAGCGLLTARARRPGGVRGRWWVVGGVAAGALVGPVAVLLILLKTGAHAHPEPDFTVAEVETVVARFPLWLLVGGIAGGGAALLERSYPGGEAAQDRRGTIHPEKRA
ncbi:MAG TPA: hypothetical protein VLL77_13460 [Anaerolineales bacterium]|nr:hypothetical protein [Anaerolineales bacterium]